MKYAFIGGSCDKELREVPLVPIVEIPTVLMDNLSHCTIEIYESHRIRFKHKDVWFYVIQGMSVEDAFLKLLSSYCSEVK